MNAATPPLLRKIYPLNQLPPRLLEMVRPTLRLQRFPAGHSLFGIGDSPPDYFYVVEGEVQLDTLERPADQVIRPVTDQMSSVPMPFMIPSQHRARTTVPSAILLVGRSALAAAVEEARRTQGASLLKTRPTHVDPSPAPRPAVTKAPLPPPVTRPEQILLIEDNPTDARIAQLMLRQLGYGSEWVGSYEAAAVPLERQRWDVILLDVTLPGVDGFEAVRRLRERFLAGRGPRIIAVTGFTLQGARAACIAAGMDDYIPKPLSPEVLAAKLDPENWPVLDSTVIEQLADAVGKPGAAQIIDAYLEDVGSMITELDTAVKSGQARSVRDAAHSFKSASEVLGLRKISGYARKLELLGQSGKVDGSGALLAQIEGVRGDTELELKKARDSLR